MAYSTEVPNSPHCQPYAFFRTDHECVFSVCPWQHPSPEAVDPSEETTDTEDNEEEDLGVLEEQRSVILHLLSQLKLGMDLTRVRGEPQSKRAWTSPG